MCVSVAELHTHQMLKESEPKKNTVTPSFCLMWSNETSVQLCDELTHLKLVNLITLSVCVCVCVSQKMERSLTPSLHRVTVEIPKMWINDWTFVETELMKGNVMRLNSVTRRQFSALLSADELTFYNFNWILTDPNPAAGTTNIQSLSTKNTVIMYYFSKSLSQLSDPCWKNQHRPAYVVLWCWSMLVFSDFWNLCF